MVVRRGPKDRRDIVNVGSNTVWYARESKLYYKGSQDIENDVIILDRNIQHAWSLLTSKIDL